MYQLFLREYKRKNKEIMDTYHEAAIKIGLSDSSLAILSTLCELGEGCLQRDICMELFMNKQTVNSAIRKLVKDGYVYLTPGNGREMHIKFTEMGREFVNKHIRPLLKRDRQAFLSLNQKDQQELVRISSLYLQNLKQQLEKI